MYLALYVYVYVCMGLLYMCAHVHMQVPMEARSGPASFGAGVAGICELPYVSAGIQTTLAE